MPLSQNLQFSGPAAMMADAGDPAGQAIAELLQRAAVSNGWDCAEPDNWRDSGWTILCSRRQAHVEIAFSPMGATDASPRPQPPG